jgi:hypothetical protein
MRDAERLAKHLPWADNLKFSLWKLANNFLEGVYQNVYTLVRRQSAYKEYSLGLRVTFGHQFGRLELAERYAIVNSMRAAGFAVRSALSFTKRLQSLTDCRSNYYEVLYNTESTRHTFLYDDSCSRECLLL